MFPSALLSMPASMANIGQGAGPAGLKAVNAALSPTEGGTPASPAGGMFAQAGRRRPDLSEMGAMLMAFGGNPLGAQMLNLRQQERMFAGRQQQEEADRALRAQQFDWQRQYQSRPEIRTVNGQVIAVPFGGGAPEVLHSAPEDFDIYARQMGHEPGTPGYRGALADYVLRGSGPTAYDNRVNYEGVRQRHRVTLEGVRQENRANLERQRQTGRAGLARQREDWFRARPSRGAGGSGATATAVGPGGQRIYHRNGRWEDAQGQPVG